MGLLRERANEETGLMFLPKLQVRDPESRYGVISDIT